MIVPTVLRGLSDENGSWKIICICRRNGFICLRFRPTSSEPSNFMEPLVGSRRRNTLRPVVDLPQPDSPTKPRVSPWNTSNETPSTAFTSPMCRLINVPPRIGNHFLRSRTCNTGSDIYYFPILRSRRIVLRCSVVK